MAMLPFGSPIKNKASDIKVIDTEGNFTGENVETVLAEVAGNLTDFTYNTEATILALTGEAGDVAIANDTKRLYVHNGTNWIASNLRFYIQESTVDMGSRRFRDTDGYDPDNVSNKKLNTVQIGAFNDNLLPKLAGSLRVEKYYLELYDEPTAQWKRIRALSAAEIADVMEFSHYGFKGINDGSGRSDVILYEPKVDMGSRPSRLIINGNRQ